MPHLNRLSFVVGFLVSVSPLLAGCSTSFHPAACGTDSDCGDGLACVARDGASTCIDATEAPLRIGMSAPESGPSLDLGVEMKRGVSLAFSGVNAKGGVRGRPIELVFRDDEYRPEIAEQTARELLDLQSSGGLAPRCPTTLTPPANGAPVSQEAVNRGPNAVLAVVGNVGTPTMARFAPLAVESGTLFFGAFTGAKALLRDTQAGDCHRYVFNVRASYADEARATVEYFQKQGVADARHTLSFDQNDAFGQAGYDGLTAAFVALDPTFDPAATPIARFRYTRDVKESVTEAVTGASATITSLLAETKDPVEIGILMTDTYGPATQFIREMRTWQYADPDRAARLTLLFSNVSFVGPNSLAARLRDAGTVNTPTGPQPFTTGVVVSQVVPNYQSDPSDVVREYLQAVGSAGVTPTFTSLEGYITGRVFAAGLLAHTGPFTPDALVPTFENLPPLALGLGASSGFTPALHNYSRTVWGTTINPDGSFGNAYYWSEGIPIRFFE